MGFDVTFHPVSEASLHAWYFDFLSGRATVAERCDAWEIPDLFREKLEEWVATDRALPAGSSFDATVGFHLAASCGIFSRYHYLRGSLLSNVAGIDRYTKPWAEIVPRIDAHAPASGSLTHNYSSGVFVSPEGARALRMDIDEDPAVRLEIEREFPGGHLDVLTAALDEAIAANAGLLEASDVIEPDPRDLNLTTGASNRLNCDLAGPMLYVETVRRQIAGLEPSTEGRFGSEIRWPSLVMLATLCFAAAWLAFVWSAPADSTQPGVWSVPSGDGSALVPAEDDVAAMIGELDPADPWPLWSEDELPDNCFDGDPSDTQFLLCTEDDGTLAWTQADLPPNCRQYPVDGTVILACRPGG